MAYIRFIHIEHPEGSVLCDLASISRDFNRCSNMCKELLDGLKPNALTSSAIDALATAIPLVYGRVFNGGIRRRMDEVLDLYSESEKHHHRTILDIRSKYAAHSINGMEKQILRVWLEPEERGRGIQGVTADAISTLALPSQHYETLLIMCGKALVWIEETMETESKRFQEILLRENSIEDLYSMKAKILECDGPEAASKGRKQR
jgi:predicted nucleic acid-binding Zn ribbon protein